MQLPTGDLSQVNYSSLRAGLLEFRRLVETIREHVLIPKLCNPAWQRFIDRAYVAGLISKQDYRVTWTAPRFEMIDPLKDAQADTLMIRNGTLLLEDAIASHGYDPKKQLQKIADSNQRLDDLKIILDSDPRQTAKSGQVQVVPNSDNNTDTKQ